MKVWSKGLGRIVLNMDLRQYYLEIDDEGNLLIKGKITDPVLWQFKLTVNKDDLPGLVHIVKQFKTILFLLKNSHMVFIFLYEKIFKKEKYLPSE